GNLSLAIGTQLGSMEVTALIGRGGMGEVYRARDTKLKRDVAIKILPDEFSRDADRVSRFQREAEVLASLNHPNIAAIYDLQEANGSRYLVLELVEGETLADRIARGPIPVEEALDIAKSICEALEAAREKGIIHRDLKPANVWICRITCSAQWPGKRKPSVRSGQRSFTRRANLKHPGCWRMPRRRLPPSRWRFSFDTCKH